ncbi:MAG TPA: acyl-CoA carboxylase subunit epsilon [Pilimelia sp.]|nr:acyl-CoA carboxylase subunit epsilon [Pilimelia sp.]
MVRGQPTEEELAALVTALMGARSRADRRPQAALSSWARAARPGRSAGWGLPTGPGPGAWRQSGLPRY